MSYCTNCLKNLILCFILPFTFNTHTFTKTHSLSPPLSIQNYWMETLYSRSTCTGEANNWLKGVTSGSLTKDKPVEKWSSGPARRWLRIGLKLNKNLNCRKWPRYHNASIYIGQQPVSQKKGICLLFLNKAVNVVYK